MRLGEWRVVHSPTQVIHSVPLEAGSDLGAAVLKSRWFRAGIPPLCLSP